MNTHLPECFASVCICDCLRAARNATVRGVYDHLFSMGAPAVWPGALKEIRVWAKENGLEDPK